MRPSIPRPEIYPATFESKIGFREVCHQIENYCAGTLGRGLVAHLSASTDAEAINRSQSETREMMLLRQAGRVLPSLTLEDGREALIRIRPDRTYLEEMELMDLRAMLGALHAVIQLFTVEATTGRVEDDSLVYDYPTLGAYVATAPSFPKIEQHLTQLLDPEGRVRDNASRELLRIRREITTTERSLSGILQRIMRTARAEGWVEADVQPALRDGRLVVPLSPQHKRKIKGIVHDESATGKTVYVEPVELVEANNRLRELEGEERREVVRILMEVATRLRPNISHLIAAYDLIAHLDFVVARARWAEAMSAICPSVSDRAMLSWHGARHPLLVRTLEAQGRSVVPLDISLDGDSGRIVIISGPNAGGKSVCLKTVALLQYMLQCGLPVPMVEAQAGVYTRFCIDIGDEQSLEDDLSTYSSHLTNMKHIERYCDDRTLILIDEFGGGTEPTIGGAIAEALLERFNERGAWGVITTHYQNLKTFAEHTPGLVNAAMLYDRHEMRPLFRLSIGRPGSSFAVEIARKIGLPEEVIARATEQVGATYIDMDKYLQDIVRDKRYWESKRQNIRREEKRLQEATERYLNSAEHNEQLRQSILREARAEAERIITEANARIERTIRDIREAEAERSRTQQIRSELRAYQETLAETEPTDTTAEERAQRELEKLLRRRKRRAEGGGVQEAERQTLERLRRATTPDSPPEPATPREWQVGDEVHLQGHKTIATIIAISPREITIALGMIKMNVKPEQLTPVTATERQAGRGLKATAHASNGARSIIDQIHDKRLSFRTDMDVRGMRASEAVDAVAYFVDDALQLGVSRIRVLHGTGTGALREAIRSYLAGVRGIRRYADEHVQLGGAGITVIDLD